MRFAFVIGNGFDLNFGLDVKYSDFYAHINATQPLDAGINVEQSIIWKEILQDLEKYSVETKKVKTDSDIALWGDFENYLRLRLKYYVNKYSEEEYIIQKEYLLKRLLQYLHVREKNMNDINIENAVLWCKENYLNLLDYINVNAREVDEVLTFSLNYTDFLNKTVDKIKNENNSKRISDVMHLHGSIKEKNAVLGFCDETICNSDNLRKHFLKRSIILNMDPRYQDYQKSLLTANYIVIFGCSMGESDSYIREALLRTYSKDRLIFIKHEGYENSNMQSDCYTEISDNIFSKLESKYKVGIFDKLLVQDN